MRACSCDRLEYNSYKLLVCEMISCPELEMIADINIIEQVPKLVCYIDVTSAVNRHQRSPEA